MPEVVRVVGRYEIQRQLGRGGMAVVYLARQTDLDRLVALKELNAVGSEDPAIVARFLRESRLAGSLSHSNIVMVHDYFEWEGTPYIAMEYVPGGSLRSRVHALELPQIAGVLEDVFAGLSWAERHGIVHRDLKPENVMVTADGRAKIADFGIAKARTALPETFKTATGMTLGTPHYIAPEQAMGQPVSPASDLYSVGCMAYEMLAGQLPFADTDEPMAIMLRHVSEKPRPVTSVRPGTDPRLSEWVGSLLRKNPSERPQSAAQAWHGLEEIIDALEGPRWHRRARLTDATDQRPTPGPYTPPPHTAVPPVPPFTSLGLPPAGTPDATTVPPRQPLTEPTGPPPARRRVPVKPLLAGAVALLAAAVAIAASSAGGGGGTAGAPAQAGTAPGRIDVDVGPLRASVPATWKPLPVGLDVPGLRLSPQTTLAPRGTQAAGVAVIGIASPSADNATLLAPGFGPVPAPETVARNDGGLSALRYRDATPKGLNGTVTVYAAPTAKGVATLACIGPIDAECARIAASLRAPGVQTFPAGPDPAVATALKAAFTRLDRALGTTPANLARPKTPTGQASAAATISTAYRHAADAIAAVAHGPADTTSLDTLRTGLRHAKVAYADLAAAARHHDREKFRAASTRARTAQALVKRGAAAFTAAGYNRWPYRPRTIPSLKTRPAPPKPLATTTPLPRTVTPTATPDNPRPGTGTGTTPSTPRPTATAGPKPTAVPIDPTKGN